MIAPRRRLRTLVSALGLSVALATAVLVPAGYFLVAYSESMHELAFTARLKASRLARYIYTHDVLWQYHSVRLSELIEVPEADETGHRQRIFDAAGKLVLELGETPQAPVVSQSAPIIVSGAQVGRIENSHSFRPALIATGYVALFSGLLALSMYFVLRVLPLRVIDRTLAALESQTVRFETSLDNMSQGLCMFDAGQRLVVFNKRFCELFQITPEHITPGMAKADLMRLSAGRGISPEMKNAGHAAASEDTGIMRRADGAIILLRRQPMPDGGEVVTYEDVTRRHWAEERNRQMVARLRSTQEDLRRAVVAAEASNAAKSSFLANMSHEIRTPLNGILGMAQVMSDERLNVDQAEIVDAILESGKTLMSLLNDVLDLSKIDAGMLDITQTDGSLRDDVSFVQKLFLDRAREKSLGFSVEIDADLPARIKADHNRVRQCLSNLVSNAIKFTDAGRVGIRVACDGVSGGEYVIRVDVTDTGIGVGESEARRLFSEFAQADATTMRKYGGTGLGLAITRKLARLMGGDATFTSVPGTGSTFSFSFRAYAAAALAGSDAEHADEVDGAAFLGLRVLLVDDNAINRNVARLLLAPTGATLTDAVNGREALDLLASQPFDLVLLDVHMPVMDGTEAIKHIRAAAAPLRDIPVIAVTADAMSGDRERLIAIGMNGYVSKPIERLALVEQIRRVLAESLRRAPDAAGRPWSISA